MLTGRPVKSLMAMTGEITLRGEILPIGGLKEKLLSAVRSGVQTVLLPEDNRKDTVDIPPEIKKKLKLKFFTDVLTAIRFALEPPAKPGRKSGAARAARKTTKRKV